MKSIGLLLLCIVVLNANIFDDINIYKANKSYENKIFDDAIQSYEKI